ncbi:MAG: hypothetical protein ACT4P4_13340 [Betaproteobacteria bacterium]
MAFPARIRDQAAIALFLALAGCGGGPAPADWQLNAVQAMQGYERLYLRGDSKAAETEFDVARGELARTGRADLVARAELRRCAVRAAALELDDCPGFEKLRADAGKDELAYAEYLRGSGSHAGGEDPLSRLVALAVQLRKNALPPADMTKAVDIASAQGWRRPLLAWLGVQMKRAEAAGDREAAERIGRRMGLVTGTQ